MSDEPGEEYPDLSKLRKVHCKSKWKIIQEAICWINLSKAQEKGLKFWQTRSDAIIFYDSVPVDRIERVVNTRTQKVSTPRPLPKIILKEA